MNNRNYKLTNLPSLKFFILFTLLSMTFASFGQNTKCSSAMDSSTFASFKKEITSQEFDDSKISLLEKSWTKNCFSSLQIKEVLTLFSFEEDKISIAKKAFEFVVDPSNFSIIYSAFEFDSSKNEIKEHIGTSK